MATERHAAVSRDRDAVYKKLEEAESLIQQKDAEIAAAEKAYEGLQANCVSRGEYEATLKKLDDMTKAYHALLKEVGDTP
ncbi:hypothetical protein [Paenibacillus sp. F4]|uniref:hypothetical protein n=1 Tax=Paenibacillus sp. F4 TaxID=357385 RepID=UPI0015E0CDCE|nr:hypothetical protein [Paenibacillus sp. F4]